MILTVDASVVVKWFVDEPLSEESRLLLAHRLHLRAPAILISEFANTIWKKVRRGEIADSGPYFDELASIPGIVDLLPDADVIQRAACIAVEIGHPVYDCLYLACAEATESAVITADRRLADKAASRLPGVDVRYLGMPEVARDIQTAATALIISKDRLQELIAAYDVFAATQEHVLTGLQDENEQHMRFLTSEDQDLYLRTPSNIRLLRLIGDLSDEERVDLLALGWFGAKRFNEWPRSLEHAAKTVSFTHDGYVAGYGQHWKSGYERLIHGAPLK